MARDVNSSHHDRSFATTHWSQVAAAGDGASPEARQALESLCQTYWYPLYAYVRRKGYPVPDAQDLTQSFFVTLLEKGRLQLADRHRGRFRSFLLSSLNHFILNQWRDGQTKKRGGDLKHWSLDFSAGESRYRHVPSDEATPEKVFERRWAVTLLENAVNAVRGEYETAGKLPLFELLKGCIGGDPDKVSYRQIAEQLGMTEGAVKVAAHRLRDRCRQALRAEIARTIMDQDQIDEELSFLFTAIEP